MLSERAPNTPGFRNAPRMHSVRAPNVLKLFYDAIRGALPMYSARALNVISEHVANVLGHEANSFKRFATRTECFERIHNALPMYSVRALNVISDRVANVLGHEANSFKRFATRTECFERIHNALPMYSVRALNVISGRVANVSMTITYTLCGIRSKGQ